MPTLHLYHGSRAKFDQLSNAYHYSGYGRMRAGWGVYLAEQVDLAFTFAAGSPMSMSMVWIVDGKRMYSEYINHETYFRLGKDDNWTRYMASLETYRHKNWREELLDALERLIELGGRWMEPPEISRQKRQHALLLRRLRAANEVRLAVPRTAYIYEIEVNPRRILDNTSELDEDFRKAINARLRYEKRRFQIPEKPPPDGYKRNTYELVEYHFRKRYRYAKPAKDPAKMTSLFFHRLGYDLIKTNQLQWGVSVGGCHEGEGSGEGEVVGLLRSTPAPEADLG
jgi:hypothetical protein